MLIVYNDLICRLGDLVGYGVSVTVREQFANAFPDRTFTSPLTELLVKSGRNGKDLISYRSYDFCSLLWSYE